MKVENVIVKRDLVLRGQSSCASLVTALVIVESMWFEVTPYPDDFWSIAVKAEEFSRLTRVVSRSWRGRVPMCFRSDDGAREVFVNAAGWFENAAEDKIRELHDCGWGRDLPADAVADWMRNFDRNLDEAMLYCEEQHTLGNDDGGGFEVDINSNSAVLWLDTFREDLSDDLNRELDDARKRILGFIEGGAG